jgi:3-oxoacyl-[acyl-carrier-protein] synthase-1
VSANAAAALITAIGMTTPVGLTAAQSCAAIRAGIAAMDDLDMTIETDGFDVVPVRGCAVPVVTEGYLGLGRWTRLAVSALKDLMSASNLSVDDLASATLYLALPPAERGGVDNRVQQLLGLRIAQWIGLRGLEGRVRSYPTGHAAAGHACRDAIAHLATGHAQRAIICAVDSLVEPETLEFFHSKRRLKTDDHIDGFIPGEAAACILIESASTARSRAARPLAALEAVALGQEPITIWSDQPSPATGLSDAVRGTLAQLGDARVPLVVSDLNGESYRAKEFGITAARALSAASGKWSLWHTADCIGDTGAASFAVSLCVAARALAKGVLQADRALILGSSDDGLRSVVSLHNVLAEA